MVSAARARVVLNRTPRCARNVGNISRSPGQDAARRRRDRWTWQRKWRPWRAALGSHSRAPTPTMPMWARIVTRTLLTRTELAKSVAEQAPRKVLASVVVLPQQVTARLVARATCASRRRQSRRLLLRPLRRTTSKSTLKHSHEFPREPLGRAKDQVGNASAGT